MYQLQKGQSYSRGPRAVKHYMPSMEYQNLPPHSLFTPRSYAESRVLAMLKRGTQNSTSIRDHGPEVRKSITETLKPFPKLFKHYVQS